MTDPFDNEGVRQVQRIVDRQRALLGPTNDIIRRFHEQFAPFYRQLEAHQAELDRIRSLSQQHLPSALMKSPLLSQGGEAFQTLQLHKSLVGRGVGMLPELKLSSTLTAGALSEVRMAVNSGVSEMRQALENSPVGRLAKQLKEQVRGIQNLIDSTSPVFRELSSPNTIALFFAELLRESSGELDCEDPSTDEMEGQKQVIQGAKSVIEELSHGGLKVEAFWDRMWSAIQSLEYSKAIKTIILHVILTVIANSVWDKVNGAQTPSIVIEQINIDVNLQESQQGVDSALYRVVSDGLDLRSDARKRSRLVDSLDKGQVVLVLEKGRHWSRVATLTLSLDPIQVGWVYSRYLERVMGK